MQFCSRLAYDAVILVCCTTKLTYVLSFGGKGGPSSDVLLARWRTGALDYLRFNGTQLAGLILDEHGPIVLFSRQL
jgi:hypothetical protein